MARSEGELLTSVTEKGFSLGTSVPLGNSELRAGIGASDACADGVLTGGWNYHIGKFEPLIGNDPAHVKATTCRQRLNINGIVPVSRAGITGRSIKEFIILSETKKINS